MTTQTWTILPLLERTAAYFTDRGVPNPRLDAELLLSDILGMKRIELYMHFDQPVAEPDLARFRTQVQRRGKREPLQYIMGYTEFYGRRFSVTPAVLIPRPETEQLVARALEWLDVHPTATRVLDFGTGSGCIASTVALERPQLQVTAVDASEAALEVAQRNAKQLGATITLTTGCRIMSGMTAVDLIISNPPYIPSAEISKLQPEVAQFEPKLALDGGEDGLAFYRQLLQDAPTQLNTGGALLIETGLGQHADIAIQFNVLDSG